MVAKKGVQERAGKGEILVDPRMKKDARTRGSSKARWFEEGENWQGSER